MTNVIVYGDSVRVPELRRELPLAVPDPFLYVETDGGRHVLVGSMEMPRIESAAHDVECHPLEEFGYDELVAAGGTKDGIRDETALRALRALGVRAATVPFSFPLGLADRLRADGVELRVDQELFDERRRVKTEAQLAGIRRAQRAAEAGMDAARALLRAASGSLTVEQVKAAIAQAFAEHGATAEDFIVSHGPQSAIGHHMGAGEIRRGEPVVIDLWPRDGETACYADMTRTYCVGEPPPELREWHALVKQSLDRSFAELRAGVETRAVYDASCEVFEAAGHPTKRTKPPGEPLADGYFHSLGHGVGLEVHEEPGMGMTSSKPLVAGDVVTLEPGLYRRDTGGVRLEDLVLVTADGAENLTRYPYDLEP
ncbi:MAG TPA: Xaa-Pro peptidase family protein [Thermomicrobiales bacterium]|nr:Xaa-Pro peptidase family protein [Thermomicrobiales bacterium]